MIHIPLSETDVNADEESVLLDSAQWRAVLRSRKSPEKKGMNEDTAAIIPVHDELIVLAVADGCGGRRSGELASQTTVATLQDHLSGLTKKTSQARSAILDAIDHANQTILSWKIGAACTVAIVELHRHSVRAYHVGDAEVLIASKRGNIRFRSICHSPIGYAVASGMLSPKKAIQHENRNIVSNIVGCKGMKIEIGPLLPMSKGDRVLVTSDGLTDNLYEKEIVSRMVLDDIEMSAEKLVNLASRRMARQSSSNPSKPDDLTIILGQTR